MTQALRETELNDFFGLLVGSECCRSDGCGVRAGTESNVMGESPREFSAESD